MTETEHPHHEPRDVFRRAWGGALAFAARSRRIRFVDLVLAACVAGAIFGALQLFGEATGALRPSTEIDLSPWALPRYTFFSLCRGLAAYALSLAFTFVYGYWAAKDRLSERVLVPLLDILQSIPVLGFMPGLVLALVSVFPHSNVGLELAAVLMIFTGQAWNMTFSFYHSLRSVPTDFREAASVYRYDWWQTVRWVEVPFATTGLVWNSMMSMAGGWFFLMVNEAFVLGKNDFRLPGVGSYMSVAVARGDIPAMLRAVLAMVIMIVALDQLVWRPVVVWAQRFRVEESASMQIASSWFLDLLRRSTFFRSLFRQARAAVPRRAPKLTPRAGSVGARVLPHSMGRVISIASFGGLLLALAVGGVRLVSLLTSVSVSDWLGLAASGGITLVRVTLSTALGTLWAVPAGLAIGLSPRIARVAQPISQVLASFPAPMLFPVVIAAMRLLSVPLSVGSMVLMLLGTQWYILFNVVAGATAIPADLREAAESYAFGRWRRTTDVYLPAIFPYLVTGWVTAAGGAWNASIVAEYVSFRGQTLSTRGLGAAVSLAAEQGDFARLAAAVLVMSVLVVGFNRLVWHPCYRIAETRFSLSR